MVRGTTLNWKMYRQAENKKTISPQGRNGRDTTLFEKPNTFPCSDTGYNTSDTLAC
ncbi:MAG: hypothetical protein H6Q71_620 [Firmicutes bacterium]|jgi:hypothetical protein|nr:hypothetical protein [Bacillota bacterium]